MRWCKSKKNHWFALGSRAIRIETLATVLRRFTKIPSHNFLSNRWCYKPTNKQTNTPRHIITSRSMLMKLLMLVLVTCCSVGRERLVWDQVRHQLTAFWGPLDRQQHGRDQGQGLGQVRHSQLVRRGTVRWAAALQDRESAYLPSFCWHIRRTDTKCWQISCSAVKISWFENITKRVEKFPAMHFLHALFLFCALPNSTELISMFSD